MLPASARRFGTDLAIHIFFKLCSQQTNGAMRDDCRALLNEY